MERGGKEKEEEGEGEEREEEEEGRGAWESGDKAAPVCQ